MLHPSTKRLINKLNEMTRKQKVAWQEAENGQVTHDTEGYRVTLTSEPYAVLLTDALGREIETCGPEQYGDDVDADGRPYGVFIAELYREASRHARGAEKAISALLAGLDENEAAAPVESEPETKEAEAAASEDLVEDPGDDSAPLDDADYSDLEDESGITSAVASMAEQVNGQHRVDFVEEEAGEEEPAEAEAAEDATSGDETAEEETVLETVSEDETSEDMALEEGTSTEMESEPFEEEESALGMTAEEVAREPLEDLSDTAFEQETEPEVGMEEEDVPVFAAPEATDADVPEEVAAEAGHDEMEDTSGQIEPDDDGATVAAADFSALATPEAEPADMPYAPAFTKAASDATVYAQSETVGSFKPEAAANEDVDEPEAVAMEADAPDTSFESAEEETVEAAGFTGEVEQETFEAIAESPAPLAEETETAAAEMGETPKSEAQGPEPVQPAPPATSAFGGSGYFGGGFGSSLARYKTNPAPATPEAPTVPEPEAEAEAASDVSDTAETAAPEEEVAQDSFSDPAEFAADAEPDMDQQPEPEPESPPSFSLSGITSGFGLGSSGRAAPPVPEAESEPLYTDTVEMSAEHDVIDGTNDLPDWAPSDTWSPDSEADEDTEEVQVSVTEADAPAGQPAEKETVTESADADAAPESSKPSRRFNPWS